MNLKAEYIKCPRAERPLSEELYRRMECFLSAELSAQSSLQLHPFFRKQQKVYEVFFKCQARSVANDTVKTSSMPFASLII